MIFHKQKRTAFQVHTKKYLYSVNLGRNWCFMSVDNLLSLVFRQEYRKMACNCKSFFDFFRLGDGGNEKGAF